MCNNLTEDGRECGDPQLCDKCWVEQMQQHAWLKRISRYAAGAPIDEQFEAEMREAGR